MVLYSIIIIRTKERKWNNNQAINHLNNQSIIKATNQIFKTYHPFNSQYRTSITWTNSFMLRILTIMRLSQTKKNSLSCVHTLVILWTKSKVDKFTSYSASVFAMMMVRWLSLITGSCNKLRLMRDPVSKHHFRTSQLICISIKYDISSNNHSFSFNITFKINISIKNNINTSCCLSIFCSVLYMLSARTSLRGFSLKLKKNINQFIKYTHLKILGEKRWKGGFVFSIISCIYENVNKTWTMPRATEIFI